MQNDTIIGVCMIGLLLIVIFAFYCFATMPNQITEGVQMNNETEYEYSFTVWPDETLCLNKSIFKLFDILKMQRIGLVFTEKKFQQFRTDISKAGLTMREIERVPYHKPESVPTMFTGRKF